GSDGEAIVLPGAGVAAGALLRGEHAEVGRDAGVPTIVALQVSEEAGQALRPRRGELLQQRGHALRGVGWRRRELEQQIPTGAPVGEPPAVLPREQHRLQLWRGDPGPL